MNCPALDPMSCQDTECAEHWPGNPPDQALRTFRRWVPAFTTERPYVLKDHEDFDRNWAGPLELKPNCYRSQMEKDIWMSIAVENEYRLGDLGPDDVVVDIGANIGSFCHLAYRKGSRSIYGFELEDDNIQAALLNLRSMEDGVLMHRAAVVRGDEHRSPQYYANGGWHAFGVVGQPVESISLDEILAPHENVRFLKIDCEGGEWPILYTCKNIRKIEEIAGEYHLIDPKAYGNPKEIENLPYAISLDGLEHFLMNNGFRVEIQQNSETIGNFFAKRIERAQTKAIPTLSERLRALAVEMEHMGL